MGGLHGGERGFCDGRSAAPGGFFQGHRDDDRAAAILFDQLVEKEGILGGRGGIVDFNGAGLGRLTGETGEPGQVCRTGMAATGVLVVFVDFVGDGLEVGSILISSVFRGGAIAEIIVGVFVLQAAKWLIPGSPGGAMFFGRSHFTTVIIPVLPEMSIFANRFDSLAHGVVVVATAVQQSYWRRWKDDHNGHGTRLQSGNHPKILR